MRCCIATRSTPRSPRAAKPLTRLLVIEVPSGPTVTGNQSQFISGHELSDLPALPHRHHRRGSEGHEDRHVRIIRSQAVRCRRARRRSPCTRSTARSSKAMSARSCCSTRSRNGKSRTAPRVGAADRSSVPHPHQSVPDHGDLQPERHGSESDRRRQPASQIRFLQHQPGAGSVLPQPERPGELERALDSEQPEQLGADLPAGRRAGSAHLVGRVPDPVGSRRDGAGRQIRSTARTASRSWCPGYFKMRSRFVDFTGTYVIHCHILAHEDRGMMTVVQVVPFTTPYSHQ